MKIARRLTQRWRPKLVCLLLATGLWYIIKQNVDDSPSSSLSLPTLTQPKKSPGNE